MESLSPYQCLNHRLRVLLNTYLQDNLNHLKLFYKKKSIRDLTALELLDFCKYVNDKDIEELRDKLNL